MEVTTFILMLVFIFFVCFLFVRQCKTEGNLSRLIEQIGRQWEDNRRVHIDDYLAGNSPKDLKKEINALKNYLNVEFIEQEPYVMRKKGGK